MYQGPLIQLQEGGEVEDGLGVQLVVGKVQLTDAPLLEIFWVLLTSQRVEPLDIVSNSAMGAQYLSDVEAAGVAQVIVGQVQSQDVVVLGKPELQVTQIYSYSYIKRSYIYILLLSFES